MNLFIINSPFQLFQTKCIIDSKKTDKLENVVLIILNQFESNNSVLINASKKYFENITEVRYGYLEINKNERKVSLWRKTISLLKILVFNISLFFTRFNNLYLGEFRNPFLIFFSNLIICKERILLDDGFSSIDLQNSKSISLRSLDGILRKEYYYSPLFDLKSPTTQVIKKCLNQKFRHIENKVLIVGNNLSESDTVSIENELKYIAFIRNKHPEIPIWYKPHRFESEEKLNIMKDKNLISGVFNFDYPLEFFLLESNSLPKFIYGINSTSLFSSLLIENKEVEIHNIVLDKSYYLSQRKFENHQKTKKFFDQISGKFNLKLESTYIENDINFNA